MAFPNSSLSSSAVDPMQVQQAIGASAMRGALDQPAGAAAAAATGQGGHVLASSVPYRIFKTRHPDWDGPYWRRLEAFYAGGRKLLGNPQIMREVFPLHRNETPDVYAERMRRAYYVPYAGEIIDHIVAALFHQPLEMTLGDEKSADGEQDLPPYYSDLMNDCSPPGGRVTGFNELLRDQVLTMLVKKRAWTLVELPAPPTGPDGQPVEYGDLAEQEAAGGDRAYLAAIEPEAVIDWEEDDSGELLWALMMFESRKRTDFAKARDEITVRWVLYDRTTCSTYEITFPESQPPQDATMVARTGFNTHTHGRVPLVRAEVPPGLWAMEKLESLARQHFNLASSLAWGMVQSLLPEQYEFLGPSDVMGGGQFGVAEVQEDAGRAVNQPRGQGRVQVRGKDDRVEWSGPPTDSFKFAQEALQGLRDEMHRVMHQMALSADNSAAALGRSGESKAEDKAATGVVLAALGQRMREYAERIFNTVSQGRGGAEDQKVAEEWQAEGLDKFDSTQVSDVVEQSLQLQQLGVESPTFDRLWKKRLIRIVLGDAVTLEQLEDMDGELDANIRDEQFEADADASLAGAQALAEASINPTPPPGPPAKKGPMFASGPRRGR